MTLPTRPSDHVYVVKLMQPAPTGGTGPCGRLEHIGSGRRHEFHDGRSLLDCLALEEARAVQEADAARPVPPGARDDH